jgi:hypothetical protein
MGGLIMIEREFEITIHPTGQVEVHVVGVKGKGCLEVIQFFEKIIGRVEDRQLTHEYYEPDENVRFRLEQRR